MLARHPLSWFALVLAVFLASSGCDKAKEVWSKVAETDQNEASPEQDTKTKLEQERELAELAHLEAERFERERIATESRDLELKAADTLVGAWAERLGAQLNEDGSFVVHEGLTQDDPWGTQLRVSYAEGEEDDTQVLDIRSAGPNRSFDDADDLIRTRNAQIDRGWWERSKWWLLGGFIWFGLGFTSAGGLRRRRRKKGDKDDGYDAADIALSLLHITFAPLTMLFWVLMSILDIIDFFE